MSGSRLPTEFASLEPYVGWSLESERERVDRKLASSPDEIRSFYDTMMGRINEVLDYLDKQWGEDMSAPDQRLQLLLLSLVEISTFVELYGLQEAEHACEQRRFVRI
ncbi:MAG: hypothetical protein F4Z15_09480 [Gammaproteobacteria bacterium]|nr:hypothetical protein [Gammaproteobacteria bacterium]MYJ52371.1 hypothetical protein [Gammaproteobacteria bacterium]